MRSWYLYCRSRGVGRRSPGEREGSSHAALLIRTSCGQPQLRSLETHKCTRTHTHTAQGYVSDKQHNDICVWNSTLKTIRQWSQDHNISHVRQGRTATILCNLEKLANIQQNSRAKSKWKTIKIPQTQCHPDEQWKSRLKFSKLFFFCLSVQLSLRVKLFLLLHTWWWWTSPRGCNSKGFHTASSE